MKEKGKMKKKERKNEREKRKCNRKRDRTVRGSYGGKEIQNIVNQKCFRREKHSSLLLKKSKLQRQKFCNIETLRCI